MESEITYPNVFFCPMGTPENDSIDIYFEPKELNKKIQFFDKNEKLLEEIYGEKNSFPDDYSKISFWGTSPNMKKVWSQMEENDLIFFSKNNEGFVYMAKIQRTLINEDIKKIFWEQDDIKWHYIIFLKDVRRINIPTKEMNKFANYGEKYIYRGLSKLARYWSIEFWESFSMYYYFNQNLFKRLEEE